MVAPGCVTNGNTNGTTNGNSNGTSSHVENSVQPIAAANTSSVTKVQLAGKVIAITGANRGIGLGIANSCLDNGAAHVFSIDIGDSGDKFVAVQKRFPGKLHALKADVTSEESATKAVDQIVEQAGTQRLRG